MPAFDCSTLPHTSDPRRDPEGKRVYAGAAAARALVKEAKISREKSLRKKINRSKTGGTHAEQDVSDRNCTFL